MRSVTERHRRNFACVLWAILLSAVFCTSANAEERGFLGMQVQGMSPKIAQALNLKNAIGVIVRDISVDGPAAHAGISRGDIIVKMNGVDIDTFERLTKTAGALKADQTIEVVFYRLGETKTTQMTLGGWPPQWKVEASAFAAQPDLGLTFASLTPKLRDRLGIRWSSTGIVVTLADNAFSTVSALQRGDIVTQINQMPVWEPSQFIDAYAAAKRDGQTGLVLLVERSDGFKYVIQPIVSVGVGEVEAPVFKIPGQGG